MYLPAQFQIEDAALMAEIIAGNSFGTLVSGGANSLQASHLPFEFDAERGLLRRHMARANPQWRDFEGQSEVLVIFQGAHGYISPRWYETELAVPTWNYLAVHAYGTAKILEDDAQVADLLEKIVAQHESGFKAPRRVNAPEDWQQKLRGAIVGFEIEITRLEGKAKMSQNRPARDVEGVISGLEARGQNELAAQVRRFNPQ